MSRPSSARLGLIQISLAGVLWGTGGLAVQLIRERVPMSVLTISAWRMGLAAVVLVLAVLVLRRGPDLRRLLRERPVDRRRRGPVHGRLPGAVLRGRGRRRCHGLDRRGPRSGACAAHGRRVRRGETAPEPQAHARPGGCARRPGPRQRGGGPLRDRPAPGGRRTAGGHVRRDVRPGHRARPPARHGHHPARADHGRLRRGSAGAAAPRAAGAGAAHQQRPGRGGAARLSRGPHPRGRLRVAVRRAAHRRRQRGGRSRRCSNPSPRPCSQRWCSTSGSACSASPGPP